jgi:hypothetical protein
MNLNPENSKTCEGGEISTPSLYIFDPLIEVFHGCGEKVQGHVTGVI